MTEHVDALIDNAHEVAAAVGDRTMFGRIYLALVEERQKVLAIQVSGSTATRSTDSPAGSRMS